MLEAGSRILKTYPEPLTRKAEAAVKRIGVDVRTDAMVTRITSDALWLGDEQIRARTVLWAAGVAAAPLANTLGVPRDHAGRIVVEPDLSIPGFTWKRGARVINTATEERESSRLTFVTRTSTGAM